MSGANRFGHRDKAFGFFQVQQFGHAAVDFDDALAGIFRQREAGDDSAGAGDFFR